MTKNLFYLLLLILPLWADDIAVDIAIDNHTPYPHQAVILDLNISQTDNSKVMLFKLSLKQHPSYRFYQIDFKENEAYHQLKHHYRYLIYPQVSGEVKIAFELIKSITDDDKVAYAISGDRDNVKGLVKEDIKVAIKPLVLQVKSLPRNTDIVGAYKLNYHLDKKQTDAYDPIHLSVELQGRGEIDPFDFLPKNDAYHLFTQAPKIQSFRSSKGTQSKIIWDYAISAKESFVLPKITLHAFDPQTEQSYQLIFPKQKITVHPIQQERLLDQEEYPPSHERDWSWLGWLLSYLLVFVAGYLTPKGLFQKEQVRPKNDQALLEEKITQSKTHKELLSLLLNDNPQKYAKAIEALESVVYAKKKISLNTIKGMINV